jgi:AAA+ superfamily predicted ATPase
MAADPELLRALIEAVERSPESVPLRLHLASLLLASGAEATALEHYAYILARDPDNAEALRGAYKAAQAIGDMSRAAGYRRILDALSKADNPAGQPADAVLAEGDALKPEWWDAEFPTLRLRDVGGMEEVKRRLNVAFLGPVRNPEVLSAYGKAIRGGLLLYGPPGCGKTFIARATAGEIGARFMVIGLNDVLSMWLGESERQLHELFMAARRNAPCVLFFDELDAIGQRRSQQRHSAGRNVVNQLLSEMDGVTTDNTGVFVLGATNHPWDVDSALLRPGRFDRLALVTPPDGPARLAILGYHLRAKPVSGVDLDRLSARTDGFSGADIAHLCNTAIEYAIEASLAGAAVRPVTDRDFERALKEVRPSTGAWFETARNFVLFANPGGLYDDLQAFMRRRRLL